VAAYTITCHRLWRPSRGLATSPKTSPIHPCPLFISTDTDIRVPAVVVSPYTPHCVCKNIFDHTSLIATARKLLTPDKA